MQPLGRRPPHDRRPSRRSRDTGGSRGMRSPSGMTSPQLDDHRLEIDWRCVGAAQGQAFGPHGHGSGVVADTSLELTLVQFDAVARATK